MILVMTKSQNPDQIPSLQTSLAINRHRFSMLSQAQTRGEIHDGIQRHGVAPGGRAMLDAEAQAAELAISSGLYVTCSSREISKRDGKGASECARVGPSSLCFCSHDYTSHHFVSKKDPYPRCSQCDCSSFSYIPSRPEECGEWWLVRRKGFNINSWRAKCKCGHGHNDHNPKSKRCSCKGCGCFIFQSAFACLVCDRSWEDHETLFETTIERAQQGKTHGESFRPLSDDPSIQKMVFSNSSVASSSHLRPPQVEPERSVKLMGRQSGGAFRSERP